MSSERPAAVSSRKRFVKHHPVRGAAAADADASAFPSFEAEASSSEAEEPASKRVKRVDSPPFPLAQSTPPPPPGAAAAAATPDVANSVMAPKVKIEQIIADMDTLVNAADASIAAAAAAAAAATPAQSMGASAASAVVTASPAADPNTRKKVSIRLLGGLSSVYRGPVISFDNSNVNDVRCVHFFSTVETARRFVPGSHNFTMMVNHVLNHSDFHAYGRVWMTPDCFMRYVEKRTNARLLQFPPPAVDTNEQETIAEWEATKRK